MFLERKKMHRLAIDEEHVLIVDLILYPSQPYHERLYAFDRWHFEPTASSLFFTAELPAKAVPASRPDPTSDQPPLFSQETMALIKGISK